MKQIFIVEDDQGIRELTAYLLTRQGCAVRSFATAQEFKTGITGTNPDLILLDIKLPDGDGLEIGRTLSKSKETCHIPVVLMSASGNIHRSKNVGARDFILKPFDVDDFNTRIQRQLK